MYKALLYKPAAKYYARLDSKIQRRINMAIDEIMRDPFNGVHIVKLKGRLMGKYRYDIGGFRIIYFVAVGPKIIYVEAIGPRGDIYK